MNTRTRWLLAVGSAFLCTLFMAFFTPIPQVADEHLALPIARATADPGLYPATDLLIASGLRGPFFLYRLAGALYTHHLSVDLWWYALLLASLCALFIAVWWLAEGITGNAALASTVTAFVAASNPYRGTIHWTLLPATNFITSTLVTPITVAALALAFRGRRGIGLVLAAFAFNIHPAIGLIAASAIAVLMLVDPRGESWRTRAGWFAAAALCALPNVLFVAGHASANFAFAPAASALSFAEQFRLYADHAYIEEHWRENYGWFLLQLGGLWLFLPSLRADTARTVRIVCGWFLVLMAVYVVNLYTIGYPALMLTFLFRASVFIKPIAFAVLAAGFTAWSWQTQGRDRCVRIAIALLMAVAALHRNLDIGEGLAAIVFGLTLAVTKKKPSPRRAMRLLVAVGLAIVGIVQVLGQGWGMLGVSAFTRANVDHARLATIAAALVFLTLRCVEAFLGTRAGPPNTNVLPTDLPDTNIPVNTLPLQRTTVPWALALCAGILVATVLLRGDPRRFRPTAPSVIAERMRLAEPPPATREITAWFAQATPPGSLVSLPPLDERFDTFRLGAGRGIYARGSDVNQLAYDAAVYGEAHRRLLASGVRVVARRKFEATAYHTLDANTVSAIAREGVTFAVFSRAARVTRPLSYPVAYQDSLWIVYDLRSIR